MKCTSAAWDEFIQRHPEAHILQSGAWGELKSHFGWSYERVLIGETGAQVLFRRLPLGLTVAYIPKGPVGSGWGDLWSEVNRVCRSRRAIFLKVEPDAWEPASPELERALPGFVLSAPIQPRRTLLIDLQGNEADWLKHMKQKTRYNIRLAERKGVTVRLGSDLDTFQRLMETTGQRDGFGVHASAYYRQAHALFSSGGRCALLVAEAEGRPLAALMAFASGKRAWYFYGASSDEERNLMPTYLLQWEAMRWAHGQGCTEYDLWGIPDADEAELEQHFTERADGLWGVYRFKRGFGGHLLRSVGGWDKVYQPVLYRLYRAWMVRRGGEGAG
jgi:lipid II:glycine glycyltransferase (peptidoglycan interpeptide bridge formation enzyme)